MRNYGTISGIDFYRLGWCIYNISYKYRLLDGEKETIVYVNNMRELKLEIAKISNEEPSDGGIDNYYR